MPLRRVSGRANKALVLLVLVCLVAAAVYVRSHPMGGSSSSGQAGSPHLLLGNPSNATADASNDDNYLMVKPYFALSYNNSTGTPNWVSWRLTEADLGSAPRKPTFDPDDTLPVNFYQVTHKDYSGSGFDRGHMCPHDDRAADEQMSFATFVMTNIIPQAPNVNRKAWAQLETYCRQIVTREHRRLYITSGPLGKGGIGSRGERSTIAGGRVTVPSACWKIAVAVPEEGGDDDLAKIGAGTRVIAVLMPNDQERVGEEWAGFRTSAGDIEGRTGLHFFDRLPAEVAAALRQKVDDTPVAEPKPLFHGRD